MSIFSRKKEEFLDTANKLLPEEHKKALVRLRDWVFESKELDELDFFIECYIEVLNNSSSYLYEIPAQITREILLEKDVEIEKKVNETTHSK